MIAINDNVAIFEQALRIYRHEPSFPTLLCCIDKAISCKAGFERILDDIDLYMDQSLDAMPISRSQHSASSGLSEEQRRFVAPYASQDRSALSTIQVIWQVVARIKFYFDSVELESRPTKADRHHPGSGPVLSTQARDAIVDYVTVNIKGDNVAQSWISESEYPYLPIASDPIVNFFCDHYCENFRSDLQSLSDLFASFFETRTCSSEFALNPDYHIEGIGLSQEQAGQVAILLRKLICKLLEERIGDGSISFDGLVFEANSLLFEIIFANPQDLAAYTHITEIQQRIASVAKDTTALTLFCVPPAGVNRVLMSCGDWDDTLGQLLPDLLESLAIGRLPSSEPLRIHSILDCLWSEDRIRSSELFGESLAANLSKWRIAPVVALDLSYCFDFWERDGLVRKITLALDDKCDIQGPNLYGYKCEQTLLATPDKNDPAYGIHPMVHVIWYSSHLLYRLRGRAPIDMFTIDLLHGIQKRYPSHYNALLALCLLVSFSEYYAKSGDIEAMAEYRPMIPVDSIGDLVQLGFHHKQAVAVHKVMDFYVGNPDVFPPAQQSVIEHIHHLSRPLPEIDNLIGKLKQSVRANLLKEGIRINALANDVADEIITALAVPSLILPATGPAIERELRSRLVQDRISRDVQLSLTGIGKQTDWLFRKGTGAVASLTAFREIIRLLSEKEASRLDKRVITAFSGLMPLAQVAKSSNLLALIEAVVDIRNPYSHGETAVDSYDIHEQKLRAILVEKGLLKLLCDN